MATTDVFDNIRAYRDDETQHIVEILLQDSEFKRVMGIVIERVFPQMTWESFCQLMRSYKTITEFQTDIVRRFAFDLVGGISDSLDSSGLENVVPERANIFMSNHRDIILDATLVSTLLCKHGLDMTEIAIGDNLLTCPWIEHLVRLNRSFIVRRGISGRQMLENSALLSRYIHDTIENRHRPIWIAQREGRAKDSNDRTQESVLKMLAMGGEGSFVESLKSLNIIPVSLSYEYDPCDYLKAKEFQQKRDNPDFKKLPKDDMASMEIGMFGYKGRIHFRYGKVINSDLEKINPTLTRNEQGDAAAKLIDAEIFRNYTLYPGNYIAYDRLWGQGKCADKYTEAEIKIFDSYLEKQLSKIDIPNKDIPFLTEKILTMYGYPVRNHLGDK
ncbi:acyltransferase [Bacteroidia bacterium]|nr:acyltransferase [Bacteroidia bacterium]